MDAIKTGELIVQVRKEKELTQKDLAEALHVSTQAVSKWENGRSCPDIGLLEPLAEALGLTVTELLSGQRGEEPGEEAVRDSLRFGENQLRPKIKQWKGLFLAAALALAGLLLFLGYVWIRDNTEALPQRETMVRALRTSERETQVARALGAAGHDLHLYEVTMADDFKGCTIQAELWTQEEGLERSWTLLEMSAEDRRIFGPRQQFLALSVEMLTGEWSEERGTWESNQLLYGISFTGGSSHGVLDGMPEKYLQDGMGWSCSDGNRAVDREEGLTLLTISLGNGYGGVYVVDGLPPEHEKAVSLAIRMYCK